MVLHGGDIYSAMEVLTGAGHGQDILDFSASINPLGMPEAARHAYHESLPWIRHYPDPEVRELRKALAAHHNVEPENILCGNGSTELISLIPRALACKRVLLPVPTFSEYERAITLAEGETIPLSLDEESDFDLDADALLRAAGSADAVLLCNPNNPTGRLLERETLLGIAESCTRRKVFLIVDETFGDFCPGRSILAEAVANPYLISLRSFTKFYGMPGLRLGYLVAHPSVIDKVRQFQDTWSVSVPAQRVGVAALSDSEYADRTRLLVAKERDFLSDGLKRTGWLEPIPAAANYILVRITDPAIMSDTLCERTAEEGILLRNCRSFAGLGSRYVRIAVRTRPENERLLAALQQITFKTR